MANHDDLDLVELFGLSAEEASGLGLAGPGASTGEPPSHGADATEAHESESPSMPPSSPRAMPSRARQDTPTPPSGDTARDADDLAFIAMLEGRQPPVSASNDYNGHGAPRGLALAQDATATPAPSPRPNPTEPTEPAEPAEPAVPAPGHVCPDAPSIAAQDSRPPQDMAAVPPQDSAEDEIDAVTPQAGAEDEIDIMGLFGLSGAEALGLGLAPAAANGLEDDAAGLELEDDTAELGLEDDTVPVAATTEDTLSPPVAFPTMRLRAAVDPALLDAFAEESAELLDALHVELETLESAPDNRDALLEIRRCIHTIKGGAKMCGFEHVVTLTHSCENLLDLLAAGTAPLDTPALRALFSCEPILRLTVQDALAGREGDSDDLTRLAAHFDALCAGTGAPVSEEEHPNATPTIAAPPASTIHDAETGRMEHATNEAVTAAPIVSPTGAAAPFVSPTVTPASTAQPSTLSAEPATGRRAANSINVDLAKVDAVVAKVTEMAAHRVSYQGMVGQLMETAEEARRNVTRLHTLATELGNARATPQDELAGEGDDDLALESYNPFNTLLLQLQEAVSDQQALVQRIHDTITTHWRLRATQNRVDAELQNALMNIRLIPIVTMRVRLDGVVRQAAQATGKSVYWQLQGGNVAVEKNVFDRLFEPLMHLLRNAIDHGLETPEGRQAAGKPETGTITVSARQEDNRIVIAVADDGAGIMPNRIAASAVSRGIISAEQANTLTDQQKIGLIFTPGFSTAGSVSHLSGRGVGMDAVREAALRMGGTIDVQSEPGLGTTFTLRLPLSLSVTRGLIVRDGNCVMALPVTQISALHLVPIDDVVDSAGQRVARLEGVDLPIYNLPPLPGAAPVTYVQNGEIHVLQVQHEGGEIGVVIEDVLDEEEILIKAPPALLRPVKTILGAYVLADGTVAPVVNLPQILTDLRPVTTLDLPREEVTEQALTALVVDDSMSMRVALSGTLQSAGFTVMTARDGQEALDVLKREGLPHLITLDIEMPRMDGLETLYAIRHLPGAQDLPVFIMTSRGGSKHRRAAEQLGATRYFTKPYRDSELAAAARDVCA